MSEKFPRFFHNDSHGAAVERNNLHFNHPVNPCEDEVALKEARLYVSNNNLDHGHLIIERSDNGHYCWVVKIRGTTRWKSRNFNLQSGKFSLGDTQPFKLP